MPHANRPAGPGQATRERKDVVTQREGVDELQQNAVDRAVERGAAKPPEPPDPVTSARQAERDARGKRTGKRSDNGRES